MTKKIENLKGIKKDELKKMLLDLEENIRVLKFKVQGSRPKNVKESLMMRRQVARILTEMNQK